MSQFASKFESLPVWDGQSPDASVLADSDECPLCGASLEGERLFHKTCADQENAYADWASGQMAKHQAEQEYWYELARKDGLVE